jgi:hypothetical protein
VTNGRSRPRKPLQVYPVVVSRNEAPFERVTIGRFSGGRYYFGKIRIFPNN